MRWYLKAREGFLDMAYSRKIDRYEIAFMLSYLGAIAFALTSAAFGLSGYLYWSGFFFGLVIVAIYVGIRILIHRHWLKHSVWCCTCNRWEDPCES